MSVEHDLKQQLERVTDHVVGGPRLEASIRAGRQTRRRRSLAYVAGSLATVAVLGVGAAVVVTGDEGSPDVSPAAPPAAPPADYVAGSDVDETMAATIAEHLPALPAPDDVIVSDWDHDGAMPDAQFASATDWQASYTLGDNGVRVFMGYAKPGEPTGCPDCPTTTVDGGVVYTQTSQLPGAADGREWRFSTFFVSDDGFVVNATEMVAAASEESAKAARRLDPDAIVGLVTDGRLTFPMPAR